MKDKIADVIREIIHSKEFDENTKLVTGGVLDSRDIISLTVALEEKFGVSIDFGDVFLEDLETLDSIAEFLHKQRENQKT